MQKRHGRLQTYAVRDVVKKYYESCGGVPWDGHCDITRARFAPIHGRKIWAEESCFGCWVYPFQ